MSGARPLPPTALAGERLDDQHVVELEPVPALVRRARDFVAQHADGLGEDDVDAVVLLTSELVTNVVIHAHTRLVLGVSVSASYVVVTVFDLDLGRRETPSGTGREGGRGLMLVEALAHAWDVHHHHGGGKTVWFRLLRTPQPEGPPPAQDAPGDVAGDGAAGRADGERGLS